MGKMALLMVLGLSLTVGYVAYTLNNSKSHLVEGVSGFDKYANARNIAHTGVNMLLRRFDSNDTTLLSPLNLGLPVQMTVSAMGGVCSLMAKLPSYPHQDTVDITARSRYMDTTRFMQIRLRRAPVPFPTFNEAVGLHVNNPNFQLNGSSLIDGRDHSLTGALLPSPPDTNWKPGVGVINPADTTKVLSDASKINGTQDVVVDPTIVDPSSFIPEYINAADFTYTGGTYGKNYTWGSPTDPQIVYVNGDVTFNGNAVGYGMLVVDGDLTLAGTFQWYGIVICYNTATIDMKFAAGTPTIYGAVLMAGPDGSSFVMNGNTEVAYSYAAVQMAMYINKLQVYRVMYWYE